MIEMNRREFLARNIGGGLAGICACGLSGCATLTGAGGCQALPADAYAIGAPSRVTVFLRRAPSLAAVGGSAKLVDPSLPEPLIIARVEGDRFAVASLRCTHRGVELEYRPAEGCFRCASLGHSRFASDGSARGGPARRPLKIYGAAVEGGDLVIRLP